MSDSKKNLPTRRAPGTARKPRRPRGVSAADEKFVIGQLNTAFGARQFTAEIIPQPPYLDRTTPDRNRFVERTRPLITADHIKDMLRRGTGILGGVWVAGEARREFVPLPTYNVPIASASLPIGVREPTWRPGRDRPGTGGGSQAGDDPSDLVFLPISYEELAEMLALLFDLPWLLAKDEDKILAYTVKIRGLRKTGPESRIDWEATFQARLERFRALYHVRWEEFPDLAEDEIPRTDQFPYILADLRYKRVEEKWDPDSKAVVFFELDTSGSMGGEPLAIAKFYFLLWLIWLRSRYAEVDVVYIPHNAAAFRVDDEEDFFRISESGGTMFIPAHELAMQIADAEYPADRYNRYATHATDGFNFEGAQPTAAVIERMVSEGEGNFNYFGYLDIDPYGWSSSYKTPGMQAIDLLSENAREHVGAARVSSMDELPDAMGQILKVTASATQ